MGVSENCFLWGVQNAGMSFLSYCKGRCLIYPKYQAPFLFLCYDRGRWKAFHETLASGFLYLRQKAGGQENKTIRKYENVAARKTQECRGTKIWKMQERGGAAKRERGTGLENMNLLADALEYVEYHIGDEIRTEDIAAACYCSKSKLEKLFRFVNGISVHDYLVRRRMMKAARMLKEQPDLPILEIALCYGYSTNESFTRAFRNVWNCNPSEFRQSGRFSELYPRLLTPVMKGDGYMNGRKRVDISELYDLFVKRKDCWFVCCDTRSLTSINEISHKAGDLALLGTMRRMCDAAGEEDVVFRIGGDEFVLLTDSENREYAEGIAEKLRSHEGECFAFEGRQIALGLRVGVTRFEGKRLKYDELFAGLHKVLEEVK